MYIHEHSSWPWLTWDRQALAGLLAETHREQGRLLGRSEGTAQRGNTDVTPWMHWYFRCLGRAIAESGHMLDGVLGKAAFWKARETETFNARQRQMLNRLMDGFEGKLTTSKWAKLARCSQDTALRDIQDLIERRVLAQKRGRGRSTGYRFVGTGG